MTDISPLAASTLQDRTVVIDAHAGRGQHLPETVRDQTRRAVVPYRDQTVGGAKIDADNHSVLLSKKTILGCKS